jgi:hypothetical protein
MVDERKDAGGRNESSHEFKVLLVPKQSEFQGLASWFHQDWAVMFPSFNSAVDIYIASLTERRKQILRVELEAVLLETKNSEADLKNQWLNAGAQGYPKKNSLFKLLTEVNDKLI